MAATGIEPLDTILHGGLPIGALSEFVGPECSGRTAVALSFLAQITHAAKICAWIDVSNALDPISAAAAGIDLDRMLWVRCCTSDTDTAKSPTFNLPDSYFTPSPIKRGLHGGGFGTHPRNEVKGLSNAVGDLLKSAIKAPLRSETSTRQRQSHNILYAPLVTPRPLHPAKHWSRIERALRATDLLLQAGGFSAIVLDMGSLSAEFVSRIPLATWFRYRAAAERTQSSILLLAQYSCAKSSAELLLLFNVAEPLNDEHTVFTGIRPAIEVTRHKLEQTIETVLSVRERQQSAINASWRSRTTWVICR